MRHSADRSVSVQQLDWFKLLYFFSNNIETIIYFVFYFTNSEDWLFILFLFKFASST
jgi:hypothetical protein